MTELNKYWMLSGWYVFDTMDRYAHKIAESFIWKCVTRNSSINFLLPSSKDYELHHKIFLISESKVEIIVAYKSDFKITATATFIFVSIK